MTKDQMKTGVQAALKMHNVPPDKFGTMISRTITGGILGVVGVGLLYAMVRVYLANQTLNLPLLIVGVSLLAVGAHIGSNQLVGKAILSLKTPIETVKAIVSKDRAE